MKNIYVVRDEVSGEFGEPFCMANDSVLSRSMVNTVALVEDNAILARMRDSVVYQIAVLTETMDFPVIDSLPTPRLALRVSSCMKVGDTVEE
ncbi:MAG: hypothetical protein [Microviridae sp.]|nr:MAG: hypothetical protein [Microviridae sp.]